MTSAEADHCNEKNHKFDVLQNTKILEVVRNNRVIDALKVYTYTSWRHRSTEIKE